MKTDHINHVVLYAKNWYRRTGDVVADLLQMMKLDHPKKNISTKPALHDQMMSDYSEWIDSIEDTHEHDYKLNEFNSEEFGVRWENEKMLSHIWSILISYNIYIKDYDGQLLPPVYDFKNNLYPQFNLYPVNPFAAIPRDSEEVEYIKAARRYLNASMVTHLKNSFMSAMYNFDFDLTIEALEAARIDGFVKDANKTEQWIRGMMYKLWNVVRKKVRDGVYKEDYNVERVGPVMASVNISRCSLDLSFVIEYGCATPKELPEVLLEKDKEKQIRMLFDCAASRLDRTDLKKVFLVDGYSGIGKHIGKRTDVTDDEFIDDHIQHLRDCYFDLEDGLVSCSHLKSGIFDCSIDVENMKVLIWYSVETSFGTHEHALRNTCTSIDQPHM